MSGPEEPASHRRPIWATILRISVSGVLIFYLLGRLDRDALSASLANIEVSGLLLAMLVYIAPQITCGVRWATLARAVGLRLGWLRFQRLYFEGVFFSLCLPSSIGGDVVNALRLGAEGRGRILAACTILADRLAGFLGVFVVGLTALGHRSYSLGAMQTVGLACAFFIAILAGTTILLASLNWAVRRLPRDHRITNLLDACSLIIATRMYSGALLG